MKSVLPTYLPLSLSLSFSVFLPPSLPPVGQRTPIIHREIEQLWRGGTIHVPQGWADAYLFLLHKPGTTGKELKHWRPIGLQ